MKTKKYVFESPEIQFLCNYDNQLGDLISIIGEVQMKSSDDCFRDLVFFVIGQQLSIKATDSIITRFKGLLNYEITPAKILLFNDIDIRSIGVSNAKVTYIKGIAKASTDGNIDLTHIQELSNEKIIEQLTTIKGIGKWTAEMFLIFSLSRIDVFSLGDAGLQRAIKWLFEIDGDISAKQMTSISDKWKPYRSLASLYLWEVINRGYINKDCKLVLNQ
jgi:DNA-3-methyladenine glycosylase II